MVPPSVRAAPISSHYGVRVGDELNPGDDVTLAWYEPGEPWYPHGQIVPPAADDLDRLKTEGGDAGERVLVHWATGNWRRWELATDLKRDDTKG